MKTTLLYHLKQQELPGGVFNKGFCYCQSPIKCEVSTDNLLPNRLRERKKSGLALDSLKEPSCTNILQGIPEMRLITSDNATSKMEVKFKCPKPLDQESFNKLPQQEKMGSIISTLNGLCLKLEEIDVQNNHDTDGLAVKIETIQTQQDETSEKMTKANKENVILHGLVQRQFMQIRDLNEKVAMLTARSMKSNVTISTLEGDNIKERARDTVIKFLKEKVEIDVEESEILVAHRIGKYWKDQKRPRIMVVRCIPELKDRILDNASNLKEKTNSKGDSYYINKQLPERIMEQNREIRQTIRDIKEREEKLPARDKSKIEVHNKVVYTDGKPVMKELLAPEPLELFPNDMEKEKLGKIHLSASDVVSESGSDF